jgi:hypothetical protein
MMLTGLGAWLLAAHQQFQLALCGLYGRLAQKLVRGSRYKARSFKLEPGEIHCDVNAHRLDEKAFTRGTEGRILRLVLHSGPPPVRWEIPLSPSRVAQTIARFFRTQTDWLSWDNVPDPRQRRGRRWPLPQMLQTLCAGVVLLNGSRRALDAA